MQQGHKGMSFEIVTFLSSHLSEMRRSHSQKASLIISLSLTRTVMMITHPGSWPPSLCHWEHSMFSHDTACAGGAGGRGPDDVSTDLRMCQIPGLSLVTPLTVLASDWLMSQWSGPEPDDHTPALTAWPTVILTACSSLTGIKTVFIFWSPQCRDNLDKRRLDKTAHWEKKNI